MQTALDGATAMEMDPPQTEGSPVGVDHDAQPMEQVAEEGVLMQHANA